MTAIRKAYLIAIEDLDESNGGGFGKGKPLNNKWYVMPEGFYFSWSGSTQATSLYGTGAKIRQNSIYGSFQGSWNASYVMDYNHLEFLSIIFDVEDNTEPLGINTKEANKKYANFDSPITGAYDHVFRKLNNKRQRSYVIKERILNIPANGAYNETTLIKGVVARNVQLARSTSGSQMAVEMSGVFADKYTEVDTNELTFYEPVDDPLTQYSCMYMSKDDNLTAEDAVEQVDSHSINIETAVSLVYSTCTPIATNFFEDKTTFAWNATAYMNNPTKKFKLLSNSGGTLDPKVGNSLKITDPDNGRSYSKQPMGKNLSPLEYVNFITYAESYRDKFSEDYQTIIAAYEGSSHLITVKAINSTVKSTTTPKGDGSKLQDSLSSVECDEIIITIRNNNKMIWANEYGGPVIDTTTTKTFTEPEVTNVMSATDFSIPTEGFAPTILGYIRVDQSESTITPIKLDGSDEDYPDLRDYFVVTDVSMLSNDTVVADKARLDNLVPKQLTDGGSAGLSGLTVQTVAASVEDDPETDEDESRTTYCPQISGTPEVKRTDYYFIVKDNGASATPRYATGYLCVVVR